MDCPTSSAVRRRPCSAASSSPSCASAESGGAGGHRRSSGTSLLESRSPCVATPTHRLGDGRHVDAVFVGAQRPLALSVATVEVTGAKRPPFRQFARYF